MKSLILILLSLCIVLITHGQCEPDKRFYPSASLEVNSDWGGILQAGITGQQSRFSFHAGIRAREFVDSITTAKGRYVETKILPRFEIGYRVVNGIHINAGIAYDNPLRTTRPDISVTGYKRIGEQVAIFGRGLYDKSFTFGIGVTVLFYKE